MFENFLAKWSRIEPKKKKLWTVAPVFEQKQIMFVKSWKNFPVFAQEKEFVIKLLKILKWVNCSVQATASLGVARRLLEMEKKMC